MEMAKKMMTRGYDLSSSPIHRVFRHYLLSRCIPMGAYQGGGGLKCLLIFFVTHYFGHPLFWFVTRFERYMAMLYRFKEKIS